jgi:hypothetical protein
VLLATHRRIGLIGQPENPAFFASFNALLPIFCDVTRSLYCRFMATNVKDIRASKGQKQVDLP